MPTSPQLTLLSLPGTLYPRSATFASQFRLADYNWSSTIAIFPSAQLNAANVSPDYAHASLPDGMPKRVRSLAQSITAGSSTPYEQAKAIERYLQTNYAYRLADPAGGGPPPGSDPVDWFLFESREGTCGNFSSAFVILARSVGLTARVVSGWAIRPMADAQKVYADQAHQRAEVALEGLGWIAFEPTASGSATDRSQEYPEPGGVESQLEREEFELLVEELSSDDPAIQEQAREDLESMGAEVVEMENGGTAVTSGSGGGGIVAGTTTAQAWKPPPIPLFVVSGATRTPYLRTTVSDIYENGRWRQLGPVSVPYDSHQSIPHLVRSEIARRPAGVMASLPEWRVNPALLARYDVAPTVTFTDTIHFEALLQWGEIPAGVVPTSQFLDQVESGGRFHPFSGTFSLAEAAADYRWVSQIPQFSPAQLSAATGSSDPTYTQLPDDLPQRIRDLALEITRGHTSQYDKAKALETYLATRYTYRFADGSEGEVPLPGHDPMDWFLFDHREGTCGVFSSAFVVLARSAGIPARGCFGLGY